MRLSKALTVLLLALALLSAGVAIAQEEETAEGPLYPFFYIIKAKVDSTMMTEYAGAVSQVVAAHKQHEQGNTWAAFSPLTGGPNPLFYYFVPMQTMGEMDGWLPNQKILSDTLGAEAAASAFQTLSNSSKSKNLVLAFSPALSNPDATATPGAPAFVFTIHSKVEAGMMGKYTELVQKLKEAHNGHEDGFRWTAYTPVIGGQSGEVYYFIGLDKLGDMDGWVPVEKIEADQLGAEEAAAMRKAMGGMASSTTMILALAPSLSSLPGE